MAKRPVLRQWRGQPLGPVGVNWGHSRAEGLQFFAPLSAAHDLRDLAGEQRATRTGLETYARSQSGAHHLLFGSSNYADFPVVPARIGTTTPFTVAWTQEPRATSGYSTILNVNFGTAGADTAFAIFLSASDATYYFTAGPRASSGAHSWSVAAGAVANDRLDRFVLTGAGGPSSTTASDWTLRRNGELVTRGTTTAYAGNTSASFRIGALETAGDHPFEGLIGDMRMWSRVLSDDEAEVESTIDGALELYAPRRIWVPFSAGGGAGNVGSVFASGVFRSNVLRRAA